LVKGRGMAPLCGMASWRGGDRIPVLTQTLKPDTFC
jgi:hypothetical protein